MTKTISRIRALAIAFATTIFVGALAVVSSSAEPVPPGIPKPTYYFDVQGALNNVGTSPAYRDIYAGMEALSEDARIKIYLTRLDPAAEAAFQNVTNGTETQLSFGLSANSLAAMNALRDQVTADWTSLTNSGVHLSEWGDNPRLGVLDIGVRGLTAENTLLLVQKYGATNIHVYDTDPSSAASFQDDRTHDSAGYNGGAAMAYVQDGIFTNCTVGFGVEINSVPRLITANHCSFNLHQTWKNMRCNSQTGCEGSGNAMGEISQTNFPRTGNPREGVDSEVLTGCDGSGCGGNALIWRGQIGPNMARSEYVAGRGSWALGDNVCISGAVGGEICRANVVKVDYTQPIDFGGTTYLCDDVTKVQFADGTGHTLGGDSGAPVFRDLPSGNQMTGTWTGITSDGQYGFFTGINATLNEYNARLNSCHDTPICP